jgi:hypothetical protein
VLFTAALITLGIGYCFATLQVFETHAGLDGNPGFNPADIAIAYGGDARDNRLQAALLQPMSGYAPSREKRSIMDWAADGADRGHYDTTIKPIIDKRWMRCHVGSQSGAPLIGTYEELADLAKADIGMTLATLVPVSHIHRFGVTFIFVHARVRPAWLQPVVIAPPFAVMLADIGSWVLTNPNTGFASIIIASGVCRCTRSGSPGPEPNRGRESRTPPAGPGLRRPAMLQVHNRLYLRSRTPATWVIDRAGTPGSLGVVMQGLSRISG